MTRAAFSGIAQDRAGNGLNGAQITFRAGTESDSPLASVYAAATGGSPLTQPVATDADGRLRVFVAPGGNYRIEGLSEGGTGVDIWAAPAVVGRQYATRAEAVADVDYDPADGTVITAGGLQYVRSAGGTELPGLPVWARFGHDLYPQHFGTIDGTDDAGVINLAAAAAAAAGPGAILKLPPVKYLIKSQISIPNTVEIVGLGGKKPLVRGPDSVGPILIYDADLGATPMVRSRGTNKFTGVGFRGPDKGVGVAVLVRREISDAVNYEDTDAKFTGCHFSSWQVAVDHYNRGLEFSDNDVQMVTDAARLQWDDENFVKAAGLDFDALPQGFRAIRFNENRLHAVSNGVVNTATDADKLRGFQMNNNLMDIGDVMFVGGLMSGQFVGNVVDLSDTTTGIFRFTSDVCNILFSGNTIHGEAIADGAPNQLVVFDQAVNDFTIVGNSFKNANRWGIYFTGAASNGTISGNNFSEIGDSTTRAGIKFASSVTDTTVVGNSGKMLAGAALLQGQSGQTWTRVHARSNPTDGGALTVNFDTVDCQLETHGTLLPMRNSTVAGLPSAASNPRAQIYVSDAAGGAIPAFSDGTNWRRVDDRAIVT